MYCYNEQLFDPKVKGVKTAGWMLGEEFIKFQRRHTNNKIKGFAKKAFPIIDATEKFSDHDRLLWVDADAVFTENFPRLLTELIAPDDVLSTHFSVWHEKDGKEYILNIIDTPGHVDIKVEVKRSLRVLDGSVCVFDSVAGVEPQSETVWRQADKYKVPRICFVNKLDRTGADFFRCVDMIKDRLGAKPLVLQVPIGAEASLAGVVDLVKMKAQVWKNEALGAEWEYKDIPDDLKEISQKYRTELVETAVEQDEKLMEAYLNGDEIKEEDLIKCIRKGPLNFSFVPILTGSAFKNKGVQPLLDAVINYLPSPIDTGSIKGTKPGTEEELELLKYSDECCSTYHFKIVVIICHLTLKLS